jgi:lysophospholipase L1-like esterase
MKPSGIKTALLVTLYSLAVALVGLLVLEAIVRLALPQVTRQGTEQTIFAEQRYYSSHGLRPLSRGYSNGAVIATDRFGFRQYRTPIDTTKKCWLLLGDSVTEGIGVDADSTFAGRLQNSLDTINVLNPSSIGYDVADYLNVYRALVVDDSFHLDVDRVTVFYCLNDLYIDVEPIEQPGGQFRHWAGPVLGFLRNHSRLFLYLKGIVADRPRAYFDFDSQFYRNKTPELAKAVAGLDSLRRQCVERDIEFEVVLLPYEYQLRENKDNRLIPQNILGNALERNGIRVYDPAAYLQGHLTNSSEAYLWADGIHFSATGHRLIYEYLLDNLVR